MNIRHKESGELVEHVQPSVEIEGVQHWKCCGNHRRYFFGDGWREVPEKRWRDVTSECSVNEHGEVMHLESNIRGFWPYRFKLVTRYHYPEGIRQDLHVLIVEKEVPVDPYKIGGTD